MIWTMEVNGYANEGAYQYEFFSATSEEEARRLVKELYALFLTVVLENKPLPRYTTDRMMIALDITMGMKSEEALSVMWQYVRQVETNSLNNVTSLIQD